MQDLIDLPLDAIGSHLSGTDEWLSATVCAALAIAGLVLCVRGARLIPFLAALAFTVVGWFAGAAIAVNWALPYWTATVVGGAVGLLLGAILVRFWVALLLGSVFALVGVSIYSVNVFPPHLKQYAEGNDVQFTLPDASQPQSTTALSVFDSDKWAYLDANIPYLATSLLAIVLSTGLAGLVLGILLPWFSRAIVAASTGTLTLLLGGYAGLHVFGWARSLERYESWFPLVLLGVWGVSLLLNLADRRRTQPASAEAPPAANTRAQQEPAPA
jgi:hypothetical protein